MVVWQQLTDFAAFPSWNPSFPHGIEGEAKAGTRLRFTGETSGGRSITLKPRVLVAEPARELRWRGSVLVRGLFDGEHRFEIHELDPARVRFVQAERFSGLLVPLLATGVSQATLRSFVAMNVALKQRAERAAAMPKAA